MMSEMKYFANKYQAKIKFRKVEKNDPAFNIGLFFDTWQQAHECMIEHAKKRLKMAKIELDWAEKYLIGVYEMKD